MRKFDTKVQHLKYKVLREVAREAWNGTLMQNMLDIPKTIVPGNEPTMRCCVYKERAILGERVKIAMGGDRENPNVIEVIEIACDECPMGGYEVTEGIFEVMSCDFGISRSARSKEHEHGVAAAGRVCRSLEFSREKYEFLIEIMPALALAVNDYLCFKSR